MNLREGTRRLAMLLGVVGAIFGGFVSYLQLQSTLRQRAGHQRFERLANSPAVKQESKDWFLVNAPTSSPVFDPNLPYEASNKTSVDPIQEFIDLPRDQQLSTLRKLSPEKQEKLLAKVTEYRSRQKEMDQKLADLKAQINKEGIAEIHRTKSLGVASIETQDGQTLYPTPAPGAWSYVLIAVLPVLGFFIPWGAVRAIGWVLAGFVQASR